MRMNLRIEKLEQQVNPDEEIKMMLVVEGDMPKDWLNPYQDEVDLQIEEITKELGHKPRIVVVWQPGLIEKGGKPIVTVVDDERR